MKDFLKNLFGLSEEDDRVVRDPEFAGVQYPEEPDALREVVDGHLAGGGESGADGSVRGLIAPYGDYRYAGPVMGAAYANVEADAFERVLVVGPSTRVPFRGLAVAGYEGWGTPLGEIDIDLAALEQIVTSEDVRPIEAAFEPAAALELQLPFLQRRLDRPCVPVLVGDTDAATVADVLESVWDEKTLLVLSGNLSRGREASEAEAFDRETIADVEGLDGDAIERGATSARRALQGVVEMVRRRDGEITLLDYRTSSEAEGGPEKVVGYGAFGIYSSSPSSS